MGMLDGKIAIITGATSGIGERTAELFVDAFVSPAGASWRARRSPSDWAPTRAFFPRMPRRKPTGSA